LAFPLLTYLITWISQFRNKNGKM